jgi:hypothetical protein
MNGDSTTALRPVRSARTGAASRTCWLVLLAFAASSHAPGCLAQRAPAASSASVSSTVIRPISVKRIADLSFGKLVYAGRGPDGVVIIPARPPSARVAAGVALLPNGGETVLVRELVGEPNRVYRVTVPSYVLTRSGMLRVAAFTLWSATRQDITVSALGSFSANGTDTLRLGGTLTVPKGTRQGIYDATVPVTVAYE